MYQNICCTRRVKCSKMTKRKKVTSLSGKEKCKMSTRMRKTTICIGENKAADLISAFVFASRIVQSLFYLNTKFPASKHLLWLYSPVCVRPGRNPKLLVFSCTGSNVLTMKGVLQHEKYDRILQYYSDCTCPKLLYNYTNIHSFTCNHEVIYCFQIYVMTS